MSLLKYIKRIKTFSVIFIPEATSDKARSVKLSLLNLVLIGIFYTVISVVIGFYTLSFTNLDKYLLPSDPGLTQADRQKIDDLNSKLIFLVKELEKLKATNERMKYSLILGDSTLFDSISQYQDSINKVSGPPFEGNIFRIFQEIVAKFYLQEESILFIEPVNAYLSRKFNPEKGHLGLDYVVKEETPIYASAGGYILFSDYTVNDGYMIIINHINGYVSVYKHCSSLIKLTRESVEQGELIALSGNTGKNTTGPHLHFEIWKDGKPVDPEKLLINY